LVIPALTDDLGFNPLQELLHRSGEIAVWTLGAVLSLSPLKKLFPRSKIVSALNRHRRAVGVTAFIYALLHVNANFLYEGEIASYFKTVWKPFFLAGTVGFLVLLLTDRDQQRLVRAQNGIQSLEMDTSARIRGCSGPFLPSRHIGKG
jgi:DMSO/TMAO reductase YedYZ heme-binding membrane subunit